MTTLSFYNYGRLFGHNATYNFCIGARGLGKTYGAKKKAVKDGIKNGAQHIYLRRYETDLVSRSTYFDDLIARNEFPNHDFRINGAVGQFAHKSTREDKKRQWTTVVYFIPLSKAQSYKSMSFVRVTLIIFDEFIIEKGYTQYLPGEVDVFNNFYSTVDRWQDRTRVLFLANSVSIMNPYFLKYNVVPKEGDEWLILAKGFICIHLADSAQFSKEALSTGFGQFIADSDYAEYAVGNSFSDNTDQMLQVKGEDARYQYTLETKTAIFSVWWSVATNHYFVQAKRPKQEKRFTLVHSKVDTDNLLLLPNDRVIKLLTGAFRAARVWFDNPSTRNAFLDIFKR